jgi:hypothetical protein
MAKKEFDEEAYLNEKVPVTVSSENDITVTLNGINYRIKKGQTVEIPRKAAMIIEQAAEQSSAAEELLEQLGKRGQ